MEVIPRADLQQADVLQQVGPKGWVVQGAFVIRCGQQQPLLSHFALCQHSSPDQCLLQYSSAFQSVLVCVWGLWNMPKSIKLDKEEKAIAIEVDVGLECASGHSWWLSVDVCKVVGWLAQPDFPAERYSLPEVHWPVSIHFHGEICCCFFFLIFFFPLCNIVRYCSMRAILRFTFKEWMVLKELAFHWDILFQTTVFPVMRKLG